MLFFWVPQILFIAFYLSISNAGDTSFLIHAFVIVVVTMNITAVSKIYGSLVILINPVIFLVCLHLAPTT